MVVGLWSLAPPALKAFLVPRALRPEGTAEVGYGVLPEYRRRGIAMEATLGLVAHAFTHGNVERVIAETLAENVPSIGVLQKCGFQLRGEGSEAGVIRYELTREDFDSIRNVP